MPKKILLDADPGVVDAVALCMAIFDPTVEIVALTSVSGNVPAAQTAKNLQAIVEFLDPPRLPRLGMGTDPDDGPAVDARHVYGIDGLAGTPLPVAELLTPHSAEKVICDAVRRDPENVMVICLGPLTNIARAFIRDPELPQLIRHLYISGGSVSAIGNITPSAEFNIFADPEAAATVFHSRCTKTLVPLDATNPILLTPAHLEQLPDEKRRFGTLLHSMLHPAIEAYRDCYGLKGMHIHDLITYLVATNPSWAETREMACDVELDGTLTRGMTVFDQRNQPHWANNIEVVVSVKEVEIKRQIISTLNAIADQMEAAS
jgi:purine nucleosidase